MLADTKLLLIVCAIRATAFVAPRQRRGVVLAIRHASEDASVNEEDVDDAALAASLQVAAKRTSSARDALEKRRRREAQPRRAVDAPQKPTLAMKDSRVKSSMEPQQELRELFDEGSWGALPESELLTRLGYLFAASFLVAVGLIDFDPPDELSDPPSLADSVFQPLALGSLPPLVAVGRALVRWQYVDVCVESTSELGSHGDNVASMVGRPTFDFHTGRRPPRRGHALLRTDGVERRVHGKEGSRSLQTGRAGASRPDGPAARHPAAVYRVRRRDCCAVGGRIRYILGSRPTPLL